MNEKFQEFIQRNSIDIDAIYNELRIYEIGEINKIISDNRLETDSSTKLVSIADIIGYEYNWRNHTNNLANNFGNFFGTSSGYQSRSLGMLEYTSDEIIEKLSPSFRSEPIKVLELDNGRKVISENGLHRYTVLRIHYLNELQKVKGNKEQEEKVRKKYEIPVVLTKVDLFKTYCQFIIKISSLSRVYISNQYDKNWNRTGKLEISENGEEIVVDDAQLLEYAKKKITDMSSGMKDWFVMHIKNCCESYDSFKGFIDNYFPEIMIHIDEESKEKGRGGQ